MNTSVEIKERVLNDLKRKQEETEIQLKILEATNVDFLVTKHQYKNDKHSFSIHISNSPQFNIIKFDASKIKEYIQQIEKVLNLKPSKAILSFADSSLNKESETNVKLTAINNTSKSIWNHRTQAEIKFFYEGLTISFKDDIHNLFNTDYLREQTVVEQSTKRNKHALKKTFYFFADLFHKANYSGGNYSIIGIGDSKTIFDIIKNW